MIKEIIFLSLYRKLIIDEKSQNILLDSHWLDCKAFAK